MKAKQFLFATCASVLLSMASLSVQAADRGTKDEAVQMVNSAIDYIKKNGTEKAFKYFSQPNNEFHKKDLYIFAYDMNGTNVAHGAQPALVGKNLMQTKTPDGKYLIKEMAAGVSSKNEMWIDYKWPHPQTKKIEEKSAYIKKIPNFNGFLGSGIYAK